MKTFLHPFWVPEKNSSKTSPITSSFTRTQGMTSCFFLQCGDKATLSMSCHDQMIIPLHHDMAFLSHGNTKQPGDAGKSSDRMALVCRLFDKTSLHAPLCPVMPRDAPSCSCGRLCSDRQSEIIQRKKGLLVCQFVSLLLVMFVVHIPTSFPSSGEVSERHYRTTCYKELTVIIMIIIIVILIRMYSIACCQSQQLHR